MSILDSKALYLLLLLLAESEFPASVALPDFDLVLLIELPVLERLLLFATFLPLPWSVAVPVAGDWLLELHLLSELAARALFVLALSPVFAFDDRSAIPLRLAFFKLL
jgi:hypothetical protein